VSAGFSHASISAPLGPSFRYVRRSRRWRKLNLPPLWRPGFRVRFRFRRWHPRVRGLAFRAKFLGRYFSRPRNRDAPYLRPAEGTNPPPSLAVPASDPPLPPSQSPGPRVTRGRAAGPSGINKICGQGVLLGSLRGVSSPATLLAGSILVPMPPTHVHESGTAVFADVTFGRHCGKNLRVFCADDPGCFVNTRFPAQCHHFAPRDGALAGGARENRLLPSQRASSVHSAALASRGRLTSLGTPLHPRNVAVVGRRAGGKIPCLPRSANQT